MKANGNFFVYVLGFNPTVAEEILHVYGEVCKQTGLGAHYLNCLADSGHDPRKWLDFAHKLCSAPRMTVFRAIAEGWDLQRIIQELN